MCCVSKPLESAFLSIFVSVDRVTESLKLLYNKRMSQEQVPQISPQVLPTWPKEAQEYIALLQTHLQTQIRALQVELNQLQARLDQNSQNSSRPPSCDAPFQGPSKKAKAKTGQPKGGQVGQTRHRRNLLATEEVDTLQQWNGGRVRCGAGQSCQARLPSSCQVQGRNLLEFVSQSLTAHWSGQPAPLPVCSRSDTP